MVVLFGDGAIAAATVDITTGATIAASVSSVMCVCVLCCVEVTLRHTAPHYADAECQNKSRFRRRFTTYF